MRRRGTLLWFVTASLMLLPLIATERVDETFAGAPVVQRVEEQQHRGSRRRLPGAVSGYQSGLSAVGAVQDVRLTGASGRRRLERLTDGFRRRGSLEAVAGQAHPDQARVGRIRRPQQRLLVGARTVLRAVLPARLHPGAARAVAGAEHLAGFPGMVRSDADGLRQHPIGTSVHQFGPALFSRAAHLSRLLETVHAVAPTSP